MHSPQGPQYQRCGLPVVTNKFNMAEPHETVLSDVHVDTPFQKTGPDNIAYTRFFICGRPVSCITSTVPQIHGLTTQGKSSPSHDADGEDSLKYSYDKEGDLVLERNISSKEFTDIVTIEHQLSTTLRDVGLQVWRGALLLCDFLIHMGEKFDGCYGLELGGGVGLCSIVLGRVAKRVFCTDFGENVLKNCQRNVEINSHLYKYSPAVGDDDDRVVKVRTLDWMTSSLSEDTGKTYSWTESDKAELERTSILLAADVIYDDHLTDGFLQQVHSLLSSNSSRTMYLALEKRLNFTLEYLDVACPAYTHFMESLESFQTQGLMRARQLPVDFPSYLEYDRVKELELWEIKV